jgi:hypothetical protein
MVVVILYAMVALIPQLVTSILMLLMMVDPVNTLIFVVFVEAQVLNSIMIVLASVIMTLM